MSQSRWRSLLDLLVALAMLAAAASLVFLAWRKPITETARSPARASGNVAIPKEPVSLEGVPTRGASTASVVIILFSDFQCPYCGRFAREVLPEISKSYLDTGRVLLGFWHFPLAIHPKAPKAAEAAECAGVQTQFWPMHDRLFAEPVRLD